MQGCKSAAVYVSKSIFNSTLFRTRVKELGLLFLQLELVRRIIGRVHKLTLCKVWGAKDRAEAGTATAKTAEPL